MLHKHCSYHLDWLSELFSTIPQKNYVDSSIWWLTYWLLQNMHLVQVLKGCTSWIYSFISGIICPYLQNCNLDVSLYTIKSYWFYILGGWHLNKWVKRWLTLELHCQPPFRKFVNTVYTKCYNINFELCFENCSLYN